jgi:uncharacterized membrane protein (UPF0136 family)
MNSNAFVWAMLAVALGLLGYFFPLIIVQLIK